MMTRPLTNLLIASLPRPDRLRFVADCETVELIGTDVLAERGVRLAHAYFPLGAYMSLAAPGECGGILETAMVGNEGMFGIPLALGSTTSPLRATIIGGGSSLRIGAAAFRRDLADSHALRRVINGYIHVTLGQFAQAANCMHFHMIDARLACWLLMAEDRAHSGELHFTQNALAVMLGVRRVGITEAAGMMQKRQLLRYRRGTITILDRKGLIAMSCGCYQAARDIYDETLG
jgi:CRP-like cAMP-binding protein